MGKISSYSNANPPQAADIFLIARSGTNRTLTYQNLVDAIGSAGVSDGDKGDIVVSGTGATWTIDTGVVTLAKMADMATASLLGRNTAGTGAPEVLSASTVRTLLALVPGTNVQAYDVELAAIAGLTSAADRLPYFTGSGTAALATFTSYMRTLLDDADAATAQTTLGLAIGTNVQAYHARLADIAGITYAQGDIFYYNGTNIVKLAAGTNGYFLKTQGAGANPVWAAIAGGGDMLASNNLSDVANQQTALNNVTAVSAATNEYVLTKDTATGNAIWKVAASGGVSDGDKGDITVSSSGTVWTIDAGVVSLSKMANMATASFLGRNTAGTGAPEVLSATTARTILNVEDGADVTDATNVNAAGAVMESDYNAHTILYATTDNTPAALTVSEQTVVGRATGGNITALAIDSDLSSVSGSDDTIPSAKATKAALDLKLALAGGTMTGAINLGENAGLELDSALSADGKYSGIVRAGTAGATLAFGDLCYLSVTDSRWELVDADAESTTFGLLGICVLAAAADGNSTMMLLWGIVRADAAFPAFTVGAPVFASTTAGDVQTTAPSGAADIIRIVGQGYTADELFFCPSPDYFEHA